MTDVAKPPVNAAGASDEIDRLIRLVVAVRLSYQNLVAAALACLAAAGDGEQDPFYYLRDELRAQGRLADDGRWLA